MTSYLTTVLGSIKKAYFLVGSFCNKFIDLINLSKTYLSDATLRQNFLISLKSGIKAYWKRRKCSSQYNCLYTIYGFLPIIIIVIRAIFIQGNLVSTMSIVINKGPV